MDSGALAGPSVGGVPVQSILPRSLSQRFGHLTAAAGIHVTRPDGLTDAEGVVMDALTAAHAAMRSLPSEHPDELRTFAHGIHECQALLALRAVRRAHPEGWLRRERPAPRPGGNIHEGWPGRVRGA